MCQSDGCDQPRIRIGEEMEDEFGRRLVLEHHCISHSCFVCVNSNISPAREAWDEPPRNVCEEHALCSVWDCFDLAVKGADNCKLHTWKQCEYHSIGGEQCDKWAISSDMPCCYAHVNGWLKQKDHESRRSVTIEEADTVNLDHAAALRMNNGQQKCKGTNRKGKPCGALAMIQSNFCEAHAPKDAGFKAKQAEREADIQRLEEEKIAAAVAAEQNETEESSARDPMEVFETAHTDNKIKDDDDDDAASYGPPPDLDNVDMEGYLDEAVEGDGMQHIRDVFEIDSGDEGSDDDEDDEEFLDALDHIKEEIMNPPVKDPQDWSWSLSLDDRWAACQAFMNHQAGELTQIMNTVKTKLPHARKSLREAESRSRTKVFEDKTVIGGTIVGCITRLEAIRATRPFAIIVEEASEVLEPLLFACLCQSTVKLQLIGDHLQLRPSLMDKFDFMRINKVNCSLFERLICAPDDHLVPSGVLSVQRRMRRDICDLTRDYYTSIVAIEDHPICSTKTLPGPDLGFWSGREVSNV